MNVEELLVSLAENQRTRHFGKYRGVVVNIEDPDEMGRIQATVPAVYVDQVSPWAMPCVPFAGDQHGFVALPEVGDGVWIEFEGGDLDHPIWSGGWWASGQMPDPGSTRTRVWTTTGGHKVTLDEDADEIRLEHPGGAKIVMSSDGIALEMEPCKLEISRSEIVLNDGMVKVTLAGASLVNDALKVGA